MYRTAVTLRKRADQFVAPPRPRPCTEHSNLETKFVFRSVVPSAPFFLAVSNGDFYGCVGLRALAIADLA